ncbi:serine/threonine-protein kinase [Arthrobacter sp. TMP15]|uniref:serine/threonine protein kinase n=1 Tax=Arthrobacter sp. TMP15 TaxID=3140789 RepID=UPI0031BA2B81
MDNSSSQLLPVAPPSIHGHDPVRCLGSGAQGQVWLLSPYDGSATVAGKFFRVPSVTLDDDMNGTTVRHNESQVTHEWRVLTQFQHEHLIPVRGLVRDSAGSLVLLMEYAEGGSLAQIVGARGPLTVGEAVTVLTPIGQVLAFLHDRGAVHGDVSPGNVLLSAVGKPFLSDFGFGTLVGQGAGSVGGTQGFYHPGETERNESTDVFALAAVGWFILTGRPPPPTRDRMPLSTFVQNVPNELVAALEAGLNEESGLRPTAAAFAQAVFRSARPEAVALGHAVHPSVLPKLLTRRDLKVRRGKGTKLSPPHLDNMLLHLPGQRRVRARWWHRHVLPRTGAAQALRSRPRVAFPGHRAQRLGVLWGSDVSADNLDKSGPSGRQRVLVAVIAMALVMSLASIFYFSGGLAGFFAQGLGGGTGVPSSAAVAMVDEDMDHEASVTWMAALPQEIQQGITSQDPLRALSALAWVRSYALSSADQALVAKINAPGTPSLAADSKIVAKLNETGHTLSGFETSISEANVDFGASLGSAGGAAFAKEQAIVHAQVATSAFGELDEGGMLVHQQTTEHSQELDIVLVRIGSRWRIQNILESSSQ